MAKPTAAVQPQDLTREGFNDGRAVIGADRPRRPDAIADMNRQASGLPPRGARQAKRPDIPAGTPLPMLGVARQVVSAEVLRLRAAEANIVRELDRGVIGAGGWPVPYLVERRRENLAALEQVRSQIEALNNLSDDQTRIKAYKLGAR